MENSDNYLQERKGLLNRIFETTTISGIEALQLDVFRFQFKYNPVYRSWCMRLGVSPDLVLQSGRIPFLPVSLFRKHRVQTGETVAEAVFKSSGTSGQETSSHYVSDLSLYRQSVLRTFRMHFGNPEELTVIGLLPSYLERGDSSLVYMCDLLMKESAYPDSGFYLNQYGSLFELLEKLAGQGRKVWLIGVSFALLDFSEMKPPVWPGLTLVETGGMKGRKKEMIREELHDSIRKNWPVKHLFSEYGMTELLSQAYSGPDNRFSAPPWMQVRIRDSFDPFARLTAVSTGGIDVVDLANLDSCAFISTEDLGMADASGKFTVSGRFDYSVLRGCNLLLL